MTHLFTPTPDVADLLKRLQDVLDLHVRHVGPSANSREDAWCLECSHAWPCPTRRAAEGKT